MQKTADKTKFRQLMQALGANFRADVTTPLLQAYWMGLSDLPIEKVSNAVKRAMRECEYMPPVAKLRAFAGRAAGTPPYHEPWKSEITDEEKKRIRESYRLAAAESEPTPLAALLPEEVKH